MYKYIDVEFDWKYICIIYSVIFFFLLVINIEDFLDKMV